MAENLLSNIINRLSRSGREPARQFTNRFQKAQIFYEEIGGLFFSNTPLNVKTLDKFTKSVENSGFLTPVTVSPYTGQVTDGNKRCRVAVYLSIDKIPCIFENSDFYTDDLILAELIKSKTLHFTDEARIVFELVNTFLYTQDTLAELLGVSQSYVANKLRLLKLCDEELEDIRNFNISERSVRSLLRIKDPMKRREVTYFIHSSLLSVSAAEQYIDNILAEDSSSSNTAKRTARSIERIVDSSNALGDNIIMSRTEDNDFIKLNIIISKNHNGFT